MDQEDPLHFGPYVVLEQIGTGGVATVYRARDERLQREVAIKVLHRHQEIPDARERFLREGRAVSSLNHPNICTIFDIGEKEGDPYLVMELLRGRSLEERMAESDSISSAELQSIATQAALALAAAHAQGVVHRDIKPANLFLAHSQDGGTQLKVLDFGLAKLATDRELYGDAAGLTRTGATLGTVEYMSPEQARGEELDGRSDLFSLGAVLYELATGDVPFRGATSAVVFAELLNETPAPARDAGSRVSPAMDAIIRRLLEKDREKRTQSATELLESLRGLEDPLAPSHLPTPEGATENGPDHPSGGVTFALLDTTPVEESALSDDESSSLTLGFAKTTGGVRWWILLLALVLLAGLTAMILHRLRAGPVSFRIRSTASLQAVPLSPHRWLSNDGEEKRPPAQPNGRAESR